MKVTMFQQSDWSTPEFQAQQQQKPSKNQSIQGSVKHGESINLKSDKSKKKRDVCSQPRRCWSSISPFYKGLLLGAVTSGVVLAIILSLWLTSVEQNKTKTKATTTIARNAILRWNTTGITVAGIANNKGTAADLLNWPIGLAVDSANSLYIGDYNNNRVQKFPANVLNGTTVAGQADGVPNRTAETLNFPVGVLLDSNDNLYVADSGNSRVQFWANQASSGSTVAGNGTAGITNSQVNITYSIARDANSNTLYVADYGNQRIMAYDSGASVGRLVAGGNGIGLNETQLYNPSTVYFDPPSNSLIIANRYAHNIVRWTLGDSQWTLIAGSTNGTIGSSSTLLNSPFGLTLDPMGNVYVVDTNNNRIQLFLADQLNGTTIAGSTGLRGNDTNLLWAPYAVALDNQLNLYVADRNNHRIQKYLRY